MGRNHVRLEGLGGQLADALERATSVTRAAVWLQLAEGLARHLEAEETYMLPLLDSRMPEEARELREEHDRIRALLTALESATTRAARIEIAKDLTETLHAHAAREDGVLYRWADALLRADKRVALMTRFQVTRAGDLS